VTDRETRRLSFGSVAADYDRYRPSPPPQALDWLIPPGAQAVLDLAAGTGAVTRELIGRAARIIAVEPDERMRAVLAARCPEAEVLAGRGEDIPLPDGGVDAVVVGQALHWFDVNRALPEIARVLVPGGVLAAMWNVDDDRLGWVEALARISKRKSSVTLLTWRDELGRSRRERLDAAGSGLFEAAEVGEFEHGQRRTAESLLATIATHSRLLTMEEPERTALLAQVGEFLYACPETSDGEFILPLATVVLRALRK